MASAPPRGGASGRGRGAGRGGGGPSPRGQQQAAAPFASQMRQMNRLQEPDEMAVLRRYRDLGATQIRSIYGTSGLLSREVRIEPGKIPGQEPGEPRFVSVLSADNALAALEQQRDRERALNRREARLPEARRRASWGSLTPEERRILLLSQKEFNSFRASQSGGSQTASTGATAAKAASQEKK